MSRFVNSLSLLFITTLLSVSAAFAQRPAEPLGWFERADANGNGTVDAAELSTIAAGAFGRLDRNRDGIVDDAERPRPQGPGADRERRPDGERLGRPDGNRNGRPDGERRERPGAPRPAQGPEGPMGPQRPPEFPFFVMEAIREPGPLSKADFDAKIANEFRLIDKNSDGMASRDEAEARFAEVSARVRRERGPEFRPLDSPTAQFVGAEMRFGDKLIKGAPFSADIVIEDTRRLYDGSTATKQATGAVYRDKDGRTRREQPIASIGGFNVVGDDGAPQKLVFINDFAAGAHYFLDPNRRVAERHEIRGDRPQVDERGPKDAKTESLGTKTIEGVKAEGTRTVREIPAGELGNDKPIQVVTETWFSPELQLVVMSRHVDPLAGEHVFKLVNIRRAEPDAALFAVPAGYKIVAAPRPARANEE